MRRYADRLGLDADGVRRCFVAHWANRHGENDAKPYWGLVWEAWCDADHRNGKNRRSGAGPRADGRWPARRDRPSGSSELQRAWFRQELARRGVQIADPDSAPTGHALDGTAEEVGP